MKIIFLLLGILLIPLAALANAQNPLSIDAQTANIFYDYGESVGVSGKIQNYDHDLHSHLNVEFSVLNPAGQVITTGQTEQISTGSFSFNFIARGTSFESSGDYSIHIVFGTTEAEIPMFLKGGTEIPPDVTAPIILQLQDIVINATTVDALTEVTYNVQVTDDTDKTIKPICKPISGFSFSIGDTIVQCTARDSAGNFAIPMLFTVTVNPPEVTQIDPPSLELDAGPDDTTEQLIPDWVKNTMKWFVEGAITEREMISAIEYLINAGIIKLA